MDRLNAKRDRFSAHNTHKNAKSCYKLCVSAACLKVMKKN